MIYAPSPYLSEFFLGTNSQASGSRLRAQVPETLRMVTGLSS
jgi:hypothetical protein